MKILIGLISLSFVFLSSCEKEPKHSLGHGYEYVRAYGTVHGIARSDGEALILGDVVNLSENDRYIYGKRIRATPSIDIPDGFSDQPYGYFVIDKRSGVIKMGLSKKKMERLIDNQQGSMGHLETMTRDP